MILRKCTATPRRAASRPSRVVALTIAAAALGVAATPAHASTVPGGGGGGCSAWVSGVSKVNSTTVKATFTLACETAIAKTSSMAVTGIIIGPQGQTNQRPQFCFGAVKSCSLTVTLGRDPAGSQQYKVKLLGLPSLTHIGIPQPGPIGSKTDRTCLNGISCDDATKYYNF